jgi:hypothetical protein
MIRIYLDGAAEPLVMGQGKDLVGGGSLTGPPLAVIVGGGRNLYLPIPFGTHCRVTFESPKADADFTNVVPPFTNESLFYNRNDYATTTHWYAFDGATDNGLASPENVCEKTGQAAEK